MKHVIVSKSAHETSQAGFRLGKSLRPATVIAIQGPLGGGKTCFVQGIALGLEIPDNVISPTYILAIPYSGRLRLLHIDAYRIQDSDELVELGLSEELDSGTVLAIEWFDRFASDFPPADLTIAFADTNSELERRIQIESVSESGLEVITRFMQKTG